MGKLENEKELHEEEIETQKETLEQLKKLRKKIKEKTDSNDKKASKENACPKKIRHENDRLKANEVQPQIIEYE